MVRIVQLLGARLKLLSEKSFVRKGLIKALTISASSIELKNDKEIQKN